MMNLFFMGGALFMSILTLIFFTNVALTIYQAIQFGKKEHTPHQRDIKLGYIKSLGLLAFVVGILGQCIGLFDAFKSIEQMGGVSPDLLAAGLRISIIPTIYGLIIYALTLFAWFGLNAKYAS